MQLKAHKLKIPLHLLKLFFKNIYGDFSVTLILNYNLSLTNSDILHTLQVKETSIFSEFIICLCSKLQWFSGIEGDIRDRPRLEMERWSRSEEQDCVYLSV